MNKLCNDQTLVVVGAQWGDEGKGRIVDTLSKDFDIMVRFQGGNNAGHSLCIGDTSIVLHLIPCGIMRENKICMIGNGVVIDPEVLLKEINTLKEHGIHVSSKNLKIASKAHIIFNLHKELDAWQEGGSLKIGTTKRGIGPCYEDKIARVGIRAMDLFCIKTLKEKFSYILRRRNEQAVNKVNIDDLVERAKNYKEILKPFISDVSKELSDHLTNNKRVLFEGAQGSLLDIDHGTYPFVTSSNCIAPYAAVGSGIGHRWLNETFIVTKAYCTRVGEGPFFSEADDNEANIFREKGKEFGATTGRPRRCGWLDLPALNYASQINSASGLVVTKVDVLAKMAKIKVCVGYEHEKEKIYDFSKAMELTNIGKKITPIYENLEGFDSLPRSIKSKDDFPKPVQKIFALMEEYCKVPVRMVTYGARRGAEVALV